MVEGNPQGDVLVAVDGEVGLVVVPDRLLTASGIPVQYVLRSTTNELGFTIILFASIAILHQSNYHRFTIIGVSDLGGRWGDREFSALGGLLGRALPHCVGRWA